MTAHEDVLHGDAPEGARSNPQRQRPQRSTLREYAETIIVCVILLVFARSFVFVQSKIPTGSMLDTILVGDYLLINRNLYGAAEEDAVPLLGQRPIRRGDIVVFCYPLDPDVDYVKRVVALPGERVRIDEGVVFIDGDRLEEPYLEPQRRDRRSYRERLVPEGHYFVLGDNRRGSEDSRYWGFVARPLIRGRAALVWYSYEEDPNDHLRTGWQRLVSIAKKIPQIPFKTRWKRILRRLR